MAATRITLKQTKIRRETYRWFCPTCGRRSTRDGRQGARNNPKFCDSVCFSKYRGYASTRRVFESGLSVSLGTSMGISPPGPLGS